MAKSDFRASISGDGRDRRTRYFVDHSEVDYQTYVHRYLGSTGELPVIPIATGGRAATPDEQACMDADKDVAAHVDKTGALPDGALQAFVEARMAAKLDAARVMTQTLAQRIAAHFANAPTLAARAAAISERHEQMRHDGDDAVDDDDDEATGNR